MASVWVRWTGISRVRSAVSSPVGHQAAPYPAPRRTGALEKGTRVVGAEPGPGRGAGGFTRDG